MNILRLRKFNLHSNVLVILVNMGLHAIKSVRSTKEFKHFWHLKNLEQYLFLVVAYKSLSSSENGCHKF